YYGRSAGSCRIRGSRRLGYASARNDIRRGGLADRGGRGGAAAGAAQCGIGQQLRPELGRIHGDWWHTRESELRRLDEHSTDYSKGAAFPSGADLQPGCHYFLSAYG